MTDTLGFKLRVWLLRKISGRDKFDKMTERLDRLVLHAVVEHLHENIVKDVNAILNRAITELPRDSLSQIIAANTHLNDVQKAQIASILDTPSQRDNSTYFG